MVTANETSSCTTNLTETQSLVVQLYIVIGVLSFLLLVSCAALFNSLVAAHKDKKRQVVDASRPAPAPRMIILPMIRRVEVESPQRAMSLVRNRFASLVNAAHAKHVNVQEAMAVMDEAESALSGYKDRQNQKQMSSQARLKMRLQSRRGSNSTKSLLADSVSAMTTISRSASDSKGHKKKSDRKKAKKFAKMLKKNKLKGKKFKLPHTAILDGVDFAVVTRIGLRNIGFKKLKKMFQKNYPLDREMTIFLEPMKAIMSKFKVPPAEWNVLFKRMGATNANQDTQDTQDTQEEINFDDATTVIHYESLTQWMDEGDKVENARAILRDFVPPSVLDRLFHLDKSNPGKASRGLMEKVLPKLGLTELELPVLFAALGLTKPDSEILQDEFLGWVRIGKLAEST